MSAPTPRPEVTLRLPPGWFEVPRAGAPRKGLLRMDPFESAARRMVSSGAVAKPLVFLLRDYLRKLAESDPTVLAQTCRVEATSADDLTAADAAVFGPVTVERLADGSPDLDKLATVAASHPPAEPERLVERRDLPWSPALRVTWRSESTHYVTWWAWSERLERGLIVHGSVTPGDGRDPGGLLADIDSIAASLEVS